MRNFSDLERRAFAAHMKKPGANQPRDVQEIEVEGKKYVVLTNVNGLVAVYRVRLVNGEPMLKGLKRWPAGVDEFAGVEPGAR